MEQIVFSSSNYQGITDRHFSVKCPHCNTMSGLSAVSLPSFPLVARYRPKDVGVAYQCDACGKTVFIRFQARYEFSNDRVFLTSFEEVEQPHETYDFNYLPDEVAADFKEALTCYSNSCFNAFASMCRRTVQSASSALGAEGKDKVLRQIEDLKAMDQVDSETFETLKSIIIAGHDGAHPHLPELSPDRAQILLELMKDVIYQLFVRRGKIEEASAIRKKAITQKKS